MNRLDLSALEIFRQVAWDGSVSKAAQKLNRVQSNVSTRVKQIEEQIGTKLFERGRRGMSLTESGQVLLRYADELLVLSEQAVEAVGIGMPNGILRIGAMESTATSRLPNILSQFHNAYPQVTIHLQTATAGSLIEQLKSNRIDVGFVAEPVKHERLVVQPVFEESLVLVTPKSFPRAGLNTLPGKTVIAFEEGCAYRRYLDQWLLENGIAAEKTISIGSYLGMFACISAGTGFGVVPESVLDTLCVRDQFWKYRLGGKYSKIRTMMVTREGSMSSKVQALSDTLRETSQVV